jgi:hypothetical protein
MRRSDREIRCLTADERLGEVADLFGAAIIRLRVRAALPGVGDESHESAPNCLEVPSGTVLSVHTG